MELQHFPLKRLNVGSCKHCHSHITAQGLEFSDAEDLCKIQMGSPQMEVTNAGGVG